MTAANIDGGLYTDITSFARDTHWLNAAMNAYTSLSLVALGVLLVAAWWMARRDGVSGSGTASGPGAPTATLRLFAVVVGIGAAVVVDVILKALFDERRPCLTIPHAYTVVACPGPTDYSFPSNHSAIAAALAAGVYLLHRRLGLIAAGLAVLEGFSRVYLGMHYPHDVVVGLLVGAAVTVLVGRVVPRLVRSARSVVGPDVL
jgi:membrane-associated phospholipid phosphatase